MDCDEVFVFDAMQSLQNYFRAKALASSNVSKSISEFITIVKLQKANRKHKIPY